MKLIAGFPSNKTYFLDSYNDYGMDGFTSREKEKADTFLLLNGPGHGRRRRPGIGHHQPNQHGQGGNCP